jgi:hypothetical protein
MVTACAEWTRKKKDNEKVEDEREREGCSTIVLKNI